LMSGAVFVAACLLRLGAYVKFFPYPATVGFTAGIEDIIRSIQLRDLLGLSLQGKAPGDLVPRLIALGEAAGTINPAAVAISILTIAIIVAVKRLRPSWPGLLVAVVAASVVTALFQLPVETVGSQFGGIPRSLPEPSLPAFSLDKAMAVLPDAIAFALLAAIDR